MGLWTKALNQLSGQRQFGDPEPSGAIGRVIGQNASYISASGDDVGANYSVYQRVLWIWRCIDAIATAYSRIPMVVRAEGDPDGAAREDPIARLLNRRPNTYETAVQFKYRLATQLLLSRRGAFVEVVRNGMGQVVELHLILSTNVEPIPDPIRYVSGYKVSNAAGGSVILQPEQVLWIRNKASLVDPYAQETPMTAAKLSADTDYLARIFNRNFLANDGRPGMIVAVRGRISPQDTAKLQARYGGGPSRAGETTVIAADDISLADMAGSPRDAQWLEAVKGSKEEILLAFGTPESALGNASGRTFDNADAEKEVWYTETIAPFADGTANAFDVLTQQGYDDDAIVVMDWSSVDVMQRMQRVRDDKTLAEFNAGLITIDEYREATRKKPLKTPGSRVLLTQGNQVVLVGSDEDIETVGALPMIGQGGGEAADPAAEAQAGALQGVAEGMQAATRTTNNELAARALRLVKSLEQTTGTEVKEGTLVVPSRPSGELIQVKAMRWPSIRSTVLTTIDAVVFALLGAYLRMVIGRFLGVKIRKNTRYWEPAGEVPLNIEGVLNRVSGLQTFRTDLTESLNRASDQAARDVLKQLGQSESTPYDREGVQRRVVAPAADYAARSFDKFVDKLRGEFERLDSEPTTTKEQLEDAVTKVGREQIDTWGPIIAKYLGGTVVEGTGSVVAERYDVVRVWNSMDDERVRPTHWAVDGDIAGPHERFNVGGVLMRYPHDPLAPIQEVAGCRCYLSYRMADDNEFVGTPPRPPSKVGPPR